MGKGTTVGLALLLVPLAFAVLPACGSATETAEGELCAQVACENGECATRGPQMLREGLRRRCAKPKVVDAGAPGGAMPEDVAVFPCAICARADNCCKAQGGGGCAYRSACTSARTTDEVAFYSAFCRILVESGPPPGGAGCGSR
jgi:hypothetical protein